MDDSTGLLRRTMLAVAPDFIGGGELFFAPSPRGDARAITPPSGSRIHTHKIADPTVSTSGHVWIAPVREPASPGERPSSSARAQIVDRLPLKNLVIDAIAPGTPKLWYAHSQRYPRRKAALKQSMHQTGLKQTFARSATCAPRSTGDCGNA
jgi:hypothetical protein